MLTNDWLVPGLFDIVWTRLLTGITIEECVRINKWIGAKFNGSEGVMNSEEERKEKYYVCAKKILYNKNSGWGSVSNGISIQLVCNQISPLPVYHIFKPLMCHFKWITDVILKPKTFFSFFFFFLSLSFGLTVQWEGRLISQKSPRNQMILNYLFPF